MGTFVAGFALVWGTVVVYLGWMARQQRRLRQDCDALRSELQSHQKFADQASRAA